MSQYFLRSLAAGTIFSVALFSASPAGADASSKTVKSGKTQVVAKAGAREFTLSELRFEMARLGLSINDPKSERAALESLIARTLLAKSAREEKLHRRPEAVARMHAAQDQALADMYLGLFAQPSEPTRDEIDDYIRANPGLYGQRRTYVFSVLMLPSSEFVEETLLPLFDDQSSFDALRIFLDANNVEYSVNSIVQPSNIFPTDIRKQLAEYGVKDNIVLQSAAETQIMKIVSVQNSATPSKTWHPLARRAILEKSSKLKATEIVQKTIDAADVSYFRMSAAPVPPGSDQASHDAQSK